MIILVAAMTRRRVIANKGALPWRIKSEIEHFHRIIKGKTLIAGRKTFEEMGKSAGSHMIVISHSAIRTSGVITAKTLDDALDAAKKYGRDAYIVGGASVFNQAIRMADRLCISLVKGDYEGDKYFPKISRNEWLIESRKSFPEFEYRSYKRKRRN